MKQWYESKTLWANILMAVLVVVQLALDQAWIGPEYQTLVVVVINAVLRFISDKGVVVPVLGKKPPA